MSENIVIVRPSFKRILQDQDACRAGLLNHVFFRLAGKAKSEPDEKVKKGEVIWYVSAEEICQDIDETWSVNKVRKEMDQLVACGVVGRRHNPHNKMDRKYQYFIGAKEGQVLQEKSVKAGISWLQIDLNSAVLHLLYLVNAFTSEDKTTYQEKMEATKKVLPFTKSGRAIPKESSQESDSKTSSINYSHPEIAEVKGRVEEALHNAQEMQSIHIATGVEKSGSSDGYMTLPDSSASPGLEDDLKSIDLINYFRLYDFSQPWSLPAVRELCADLLPQHVRKQLGTPECSKALNECAQKLYDYQPLQKRGLRSLARLLGYVNHPSKPSGLSQYLGHFPNPVQEVQMRLLTSPKRPENLGMIAMALQELESRKEPWWPEYLKPAMGSEEPPTIDLAELAGTPPDERFGFYEAELEIWLKYLAPWQKLGYDVSWSAVECDSERGYAIEIRSKQPQRVIRFSCRRHWNLIMQAAEEANGGFGSRDFVAWLMAAPKTKEGGKEEHGNRSTSDNERSRSAVACG